LLVTVDQVIDGVHVTASTTNWADIGTKAVHRSVSDIAAMAGRPVASVISVALPIDATREQFDALRVALGEAAAQCHAPLVGGDIAVHASSSTAGPLSISVTVLGVPSEGGAVLRSGGCVGDAVWVTGELGRTLDVDGQGHHLHFAPRVDVALALHDLLGTRLHAMMDISDGLGRDGARLAEASNCTMQVTADALPCRGTATWQQAIVDGEDYELLFACDPSEALPAALCNVSLTHIGTLTAVDARGAMLVRCTNGEVCCGDDLGWDHTT
jgi:thiamine-monophosphate kinase